MMAEMNPNTPSHDRASINNSMLVFTILHPPNVSWFPSIANLASRVVTIPGGVLNQPLT
jgi:hypothetical protein